MSISEILWRIRSKMRQRREWRYWKQNVKQSFGRVDVEGAIQNAQRLVIGAQDGQLSTLEYLEPSQFDALRSRLKTSAEGITRGRIEMLGHPFDLTGYIDWHRDPRSDYRWSRTFYSDLAIAELPDGADVKYVWELGRQQYVVDLAGAWKVLGNAMFADHARDFMVSWIKENPLYEGVHWTSALEVAMRAISWIWTIGMLGEWDGWQNGDMLTILESLVQHADYLEHHLELYSSPFNHLIGESVALCLISSVLSEHALASRWTEIARKSLKEHGPRQFYVDGFGVEQATGYHFYTLGFLLMAVIAARQFGNPMEDLEQLVHRAALAGKAFRRPDGKWPAIGDVDSARAMPVNHEEFWDFGSLCNVAAVLFGDGDLKVADTGVGEEVFWLLGCDGVEKWQHLPNTQEEPITLLSDSGYVIAKDNENYVLFEAGSVGAGLHSDATPSTAHGHSDSLQVIYYAGGESVLHDSGMPYYNGDIGWIQYFRSSAAHNTVSIQGCDYVRAAGRLAWSNEVCRPTLEVNTSGDAWLAHGHVEWPSVLFDRHLLCLPGSGLWIADHIVTDRERDIQWCWQLSDFSASDVQHGEGLAVQFSNRELRMTSTGGAMKGRINKAVAENPAGWRCPGYGLREPASQLVVNQTTKSQILVLTEIVEAVGVHQVTVRTDGLMVGQRRSDCHDVRETQSGALFWTISLTGAANQDATQSIGTGVS